jgi:hypothetical protein
VALALAWALPIPLGWASVLSPDLGIVNLLRALRAFRNPPMFAGTPRVQNSTQTTQITPTNTLCLAADYGCKCAGFGLTTGLTLEPRVGLEVLNSIRGLASNTQSAPTSRSNIDLRRSGLGMGTERGSIRQRH